MTRSERLNQIMNMLVKYGKVDVASLCQLFQVSEMTIRRDLTILCQENRAIRSHGGATLPPNMIFSESPYIARAVMHNEEKQRIAQAALSLIHENDVIFFDSSTTGNCLAKRLPSSYSLMAVTDTLHTAISLAEHTNVQVMTLGGELNKSTCSNYGIFAETTLKAMQFDICFIGVPRITTDGEVSIACTTELSLKRMVLERSRKRVLLADSSKTGNPSFLNLANISDFDVFVTDSKIPDSIKIYCQEHDVQLLIAP